MELVSQFQNGASCLLKATVAMQYTNGFMADCYFNYVDVGAYGLPRQMSRPNWINVVREPISRFISHFYYMSRDWRMQNKVLPPEEAKVHTKVDKRLPTN